MRVSQGLTSKENKFLNTLIFEQKLGQIIINTIMTLELVGQLVSLFLILGAGPIVIVLLFARGGNL